MDLIYTDKQRADVGVLQDFTLDLAFGADENDFELTVDLNRHCCEADCLVYVENTEYGGIIDGLNIVTEEDKLTYKGRTWQGILASKVIEPEPGKAYLTVSGEANRVIGDLIVKLGLGDLLVASTENSGITINSYSFNRYVDAYSGLSKMLELASGKLKFSFNGSRCVVSAKPSVDYSKDEEFDSDLVSMNISKMTNKVNHLICLGKGELTDRLVIHMYADEEGNISGTQTFRGTQEITAVYDYSSAESAEELTESGREKFKEYINSNSVQLDLSANDNTYDVGDIVGARENITNTVTKARITKKIVTINKNEVNIQYKVGE